MVRAPGISNHDIGAIAPLAQDSGLKTQDLACDPVPVQSGSDPVGYRWL